MAILGQEKLASTLIGFNAVFNDALKNAPLFFKSMATQINTDRPTVTLPWMGVTPQFKEWISDRSIAKLRAYAESITAKKWANGLEVSEDDIEDDILGLYAPMVQGLAQAAAQHYDHLLFDFLDGGFAGTKSLAYDGQYFLDTDHKDGDGPTQSNKGTAALATASYRAAWQAMQTLVDENGEPLDITPTTLIVGPQLRGTARDILLADRNANGATNTDYESAKLIVSARITGAHWFLADLSKPVKPLVLVVRRPPRFRQLNSPNDEGAFKNGKLFFGADSRDNAGYGLWQLIYGSDGTT